MRLARKAIERRLKAFSDVKGISSLLSEEEKEKLFSVAVRVAERAVSHASSKKALGANVAQSVVRNYLFALLTGNAVKKAMENKEAPLVLEMGSGSGINALAALAVCPGCQYLGIEKDGKSIAFAQKTVKSENARFVKADFSRVKIRARFDVVINENLGPNAVDEPQVLAANAALHCSHSGTLPVPAKARVYARMKKRTLLTRLDFSKKLPLSVSASVKRDSASFRLETEVLDFRGRTAVRQRSVKDFISYLPLIGERIPLPGKKNVKITLDFKEGMVEVE